MPAPPNPAPGAKLFLPDIDSVWARGDLATRPLDATRVYRMLTRNHAAQQWLDVVLPEHHVERVRGDVHKPHRCGKRCRDSVRLPVVGAEDVLCCYVAWWRLICRANDWHMATRVVEQGGYDAQTQVRAAGFHPLPVFTLAQAVSIDALVVESAEPTGVVWSIV